MTKKIDWSDIKNRRGLLSLVDDVFMLVVVLLNLLFIIFDWHFNFPFFRNFLQDVTPRFFEFYRDEIHPNFLLYDLIFVSIFLIELLISWVIAIKRQTYSRWWFYPFVHWYDVLGCVPLATFRWLRFFRVASMLLRLHKMGVIDLKQNIIYKKINEIYKIFTDRVTDRVLINLVSGIQREVTKESSPKEEGSNTVADAVKPDQEELARLVTQRIQRTAENNYNSYKDDLKERIETIVTEGFENSQEMQKIENLPMVGKQITETLEKSLSDITYQLVDSLLQQTFSKETGELLENSIHTTLDSALSDEKDDPKENEEELNRVIRNILGRILESMKNDIGKDIKGNKDTANIENLRRK